MELKINPYDNIPNNDSNNIMRSFKSLKSEKLPISTLAISKKSKDFVNSIIRKYSYDPKLYIKNFVPVLHPMPNDSKLIPSKLNLGNKKRNSSTLSNPSSEDEDKEEIANEELNLSNSFVNSLLSDSSSESEDDGDNPINSARKNFSKIRKYSIYREKNLTPRKISLDNKKDLEENLDSNLNNNIKELHKSLKINQFKNFPKRSLCMFPDLRKNKNTINNELQKKKRNRINSFSILETLQNKIKIEK